MNMEQRPAYGKKRLLRREEDKLLRVLRRRKVQIVNVKRRGKWIAVLANRGDH